MRPSPYIDRVCVIKVHLVLQVLPCPQCGKQSLIPHQVSLEASIRCPHCAAQLVVGEVLLSQFSSWEIIDDPAEAFGQPPRKLDPGVVVPVPTENVEGQLCLAPFNPDQDPVSPPQASTLESIARSGSMSEYERRRRKQKSPIWSVIPVVLGGVAAFPIALLIIWHVLGRDIGGLGPKVAEFAPWIVPKRLHPFAADNNNANVRPVGEGRGRAVPERGASGFRQFDDVMPEPKKAPELDDAGDSGSDAAKEDNSDSASNSSAKAIPRAPVTNADSNQPDSAVSNSPGMDLFSQIRASRKLIDDLAKSVEAERSDRSQLAREFFEKLRILAQAFGNIDKQNPVWRKVKDEAGPLARQITQNAKIADVMTGLATKAASDAKKVELTGDDRLWLPTTLEVTSAELVDSVWIVSGKHAFDKSTVVEIPRSLSPQVMPEQKLWVLGALKFASGDSATPATFQVSYLYSM
ncbi:MAG: hypothetical protein U0930_03100 [Pirellulales bacterium]